MSITAVSTVSDVGSVAVPVPADIVTEPEGYATYRSERLPDQIKGGAGKHNVPADNQGVFDIDVYISPEFIQDISAELASNRRELSDLGLQNAPVEVYIKGDDTHMTKWNLGNEDVIYKRNW